MAESHLKNQDAENEGKVQQALDDLVHSVHGNCSVVLIAHRLSTVIGLDRWDLGRGFTWGTLEVVGISVGFNLSKWRFHQRWDLTSHNEYGIEAGNMFFFIIERDLTNNKWHLTINQ